MRWMPNAVEIFLRLDLAPQLSDYSIYPDTGFMDPRRKGYPRLDCGLNAGRRHREF